MFNIELVGLFLFLCFYKIQFTIFYIYWAFESLGLPAETARGPILKNKIFAAKLQIVTKDSNELL
jgi:hypothetical protein